MAKLLVYSSSAGSGKTYTLTRTYLKLLLGSPLPDYFRHILAITFTNDAANEMKERILDTLADLASSSPEVPSTVAFAQEIDISAETLVLRAQKAQEALLQEYSDFHVKTIDSFMNQVVQQFTEDLDLPFHYETALEADPLLVEAVDLVLEKLSINEPTPLNKSIIQIAEEVVTQNKSWTKIRDTLLDTSRDFLNDQHFFQISRLIDLETGDFQAISSVLKQAIQENQEKVKSWGRKGLDIIESAGIQPTDFYQGKNGLGGLFQKLCRDPEKYSLPEELSSYYFDTVDSNKWTGAKASESSKHAIAGIQDPLTDLFNLYRNYQENEATRWAILKNIQKDLFKLPLIQQIKQAFDEVLQANNQVYIADFNRRILEIVLHEPVPFIYERLGEKFHHLLIDEFQDTSELQFFNLLPLIENGLAQGFFSLVVGDAKQAIYRWRGGKMSLLVHLANQNLNDLLQNPIISDIQREQFFSIAPYLERANLVTNYRSTKEIIAFNNALFNFILETKKEMIPFLGEVYSDYFQETPETALAGGRVEIKLASPEQWLEETLQQLIHFKESGYAWGDMACLVRKNDISGQLAEYLVAHQVPISTSDSLLLHRAWEIQLLIGLLESEANPQRPELRIAPLALYAQTTQSEKATPSWLASLHQITSWESSLNFWQDLGVTLPTFHSSHQLYAQVESWAHALGLFGIKGRTEYIVTFLEFILQVTTQQGNHVLDFLTQWKKKKNSLSVQTQAKSDAVTIQTIHKAKGLAYPVVLLPFLDWSMTPKTTQNVWFDLTPLNDPLLQVETDSGGIRRLPTARLNPSESLLRSPLADQVAEERTQVYLESLNMLYVALTRPQEKLWISLAQPKKKNEHSISSVMQSFLETQERSSDGHWVISEGIEGPLRPSKVAEPNATDETLPLVWRGMVVNPQEKLRLRRSAERFFEVQSADRSKDRGTKIHTLLAEISSVVDVEPTVRRACYAGWIAEEEVESLTNEIMSWLQIPDLSPYFASGLKIDRERDLILPEGQSLRPDRVVYFPDRTVIIDFKTGQPRAQYIQQLQQYAEAFQAMEYPSVEAWLVYLDERMVRQAYPLPHS